LKGKATVADRIGTVSGGREECSSPRTERFSYRVSLLVNLAASAALYGLAYFVVIGVIHLVEALFAR